MVLRCYKGGGVNAVNIRTTLSGLVLCLAAHSNLLAQLCSQPSSSVVDGIVRRTVGGNAGLTHWDSPSGLGAYKIAANGTVPLPGSGAAFSSALPASFSADRARLNARGGSVRAIFLGESAGWLNGFGYCYDGNPAGAASYSIFSSIQACARSPEPINVHFGDYVDIPFSAGSVGAFDFWLNAAGGDGPDYPPTPSLRGGVYSVFNPSGSSPNLSPGNTVFLQQPLIVSTWDPAVADYRNIVTYVVGFEDSRADKRIDADYSDLVVGFQFFVPAGTPLAASISAESAAVPEPAATLWLGALVLCGLLLCRRFFALRARGSCQ